MREAATITVVPMTDFEVDSVESYNAMVAMTTALPNLQQITLHYLGHGHKYSDGEDPDEEWGAETANRTTYDMEIISRFGKLRDLKIHVSPLNGRYPFLFNFPFLQSLTISYCGCLKWDLEELAGLPLLTDLYCYQIPGLTGNISSLTVLKNTLTHVTIDDSYRVGGNFMDLADFPHLKTLKLRFTAVTGDIRVAGENDFSALKELTLPEGVYGGMGHTFQRVSDAPDVINTLYSFKKQRPSLQIDWYGILSGDSPDWYEGFDDVCAGAPFIIHFVEAGSRWGWRWENESSDYGPGCCVPCEVNWLDSEPEKDSVDYEQYVRELQNLQKQTVFYKGYYQPPTEEEYNRLCEGLNVEGADYD